MTGVCCYAGAPLAGGAGWRVWYGAPEGPPYVPEPVTVRLASRDVAARVRISERPTVPELGWQVVIADLLLGECSPGALYDVAIPEAGRTLRWHSLPDRLPPEGLNVLLVSCFWRNDDKQGCYGTAVNSFCGHDHSRPHFKLLVGDQVYLDYPLNFETGRTPEQIIAARYREYLCDEAYRGALQATPNFFVCDDHEYWNDYPEKQIHLERSWPPNDVQYGAASDRYYVACQKLLNPGAERWTEFSVGKASFFMADTRSQRSHVASSRPRFMAAEQWSALGNWIDTLRGPGFLVTGQPVFQKDGNWKDHSLSNFADEYAALLQMIERSLRGHNREGRPHDVVILTGDIHTGRYARATVANLPDVMVHEFVASPASRVGPFLSEPDPEAPPSLIRAGREVPDHPAPVSWKVSSESGVPFMSVDNNVALLRLYDSEKENCQVRMEFQSYMVRRHHRPAWQFWRRESDTPTAGPEPLLARPVSLDLK